MPKFAPLVKVERCRTYGARIILHGDNILDAMEKANDYVREEKLTYINGFDDQAIIAGQGTVDLPR